MKKNILCMSLICAGVLLTACDSPNITKEQSDMISQYSASLLLKYDSDTHSRLVDTSAFHKLYDEAVLNYEEAKNAYEEQVKKEEEKRLAELKAQEEANKSENEEDDSDTFTQESKSETPVIDTRTITDLLGIDYSFEYVKSESVSAFRESVPHAGCKYVLIYFDVTNNKDSADTLNILEKNISFKAVFDNSVEKGNQFSLYDDDLVMYLGDFKPKETKRLFLLVEVATDVPIDNILLKTTYEGDTIVNKLE